jgi:hypothetical protein
VIARLRTIRHQVWTDTRGLSLYLAAWAVAMAAQATLIALGPAGLIDIRRGTPYSPDTLVVILRVIVTVVLTVLVIHRDPAVGTTAFWRTRPVSAGTMWASKVAWMALWLVGAPAAVTIVVFAWLGLGILDAVYGGLLVAFDQTMVAGIALMAAAVTDTIAHFTVAGFAGAAIYATVMTTLQRPLQALLPRLETTGAWTPQTVWAVLMCAGGMAVLAIAYLTRRLAVAAVLIGIVLCSTVVAITSVHWTWAGWMPRPANITLAGSERISIAAVPGSIRVVPVGPSGITTSNDASQMKVYDNLDVSGAPPDVMFSVLAVDSILRVPEHEDIRWHGPGQTGESTGSPATADSQPFRSMRSALGGAEIVIPAGSAARLPNAALTAIARDIFERVAAQAAVLDASVTMRAYRYKAATRMPMVPGATAHVGQSPVTVTAVERSVGGVVVTIKAAVVSGPRRSPLELGTSVVLCNAARRVGIYRTQARISSTWMNFGLFLDRVGTETRRLEFIPGPDTVTRIGLDDDWLAGAELVFLGTEELGTITKPLRITGLKLK